MVVAGAVVRWELTGSQALLLWDCGEKGTPFLRGHLWVAVISCTQPLGQVAVSLPAGMNSLEEVTEHMNKILNIFQVRRGISCPFNTAGNRKGGADRPGDKMPTPELLLMVFLVHYSNRLKILKPRRDYHDDLVSPSV